MLSASWATILELNSSSRYKIGVAIAADLLDVSLAVHSDASSKSRS
jgi:hypothetical protein